MARGDVPILANIKTPEKEITLSWKELIKIFTGNRTRWPNGQKVKILLLPPDNPIQRNFIRKVLGYSPYKFFNIVKNNKNNIFYENFVDENKMVLYLQQIPGSIGLTERYFLYYNSGSRQLVKIRIQF